MVQRVTTCGKTRDNEWQGVTTNDNEWQRVIILANFPFSQIREENTTIHPKGDSLNVKGNLDERLLN